MNIASEKGFVLKLGDISCAFPYAHLPPGEKLYLLPPESERKPGKIWKLLRALYGLRRSPQFFQDHFAAELEKMGCRRLISDPQLFIHEKLQVYLLAHVDDMMIAGTHVNVEKVVEMPNDIFKIKWTKELNSESWAKFLGREWKRKAMTENNKDIQEGAEGFRGGEVQGSSYAVCARREAPRRRGASGGWGEAGEASPVPSSGWSTAMDGGREARPLLRDQGASSTSSTPE